MTEIVMHRYHAKTHGCINCKKSPGNDGQNHLYRNLICKDWPRLCKLLKSFKDEGQNNL